MSQRHYAPHSQMGWSLIETTVALAIVGLLVGSSIPSFQQMLARRLIEGRASELQSNLLLARSEAVARGMPVLMSFKTSGSSKCYVLQTGKARDCECVNDAPARCVNGAHEIRTIPISSGDSLDIQSNVDSISFDPVRGTASLGTITLSARRQSVNLVVNKSGRVRQCTTTNIPGLNSCSAASR